MSKFNLSIPTEITQEGVVQFLNENIEKVQRAIDTDMTYLLTGTISETPTITNVQFVSDSKLKIEYEFHWWVHNVCRNAIDDSTEKGNFNASIAGKVITFDVALSPQDRSTQDEL